MPSWRGGDPDYDEFGKPVPGGIVTDAQQGASLAPVAIIDGSSGEARRWTTTDRFLRSDVATCKAEQRGGVGPGVWVLDVEHDAGGAPFKSLRAELAEVSLADTIAELEWPSVSPSAAMDLLTAVGEELLGRRYYYYARASGQNRINP